MRILLLHNRYQHAGGEDAVVCSERAMLESRGHSVAILEADNDAIEGVAGMVRTAFECVYSPASRRRMKEKLHSFRPDIVHAHNLFPILSPSVMYACADAGIPFVQTLHNFRMLCANALMFRDGEICEDCLGRRFGTPGVIHGCYRGSKTGSFAIATLSAVHFGLGTYVREVARYIALTDLARNKFIEGGLPAEKLEVKPNFVEQDPGVGDGSGDFVLYVGRLTSEKGIDVLLREWDFLGSSVELRIVGEGPLAESCRHAVAKSRVIKYLGFKSLPEIFELMGRAKALVFPSLWYEGFPRAIVESFAKGTPVIASNLGSMEKMIEHRRTGLHFDPRTYGALAEQVEWMLSHRTEWLQCRSAARAEYESKYTADKNYEILMNIYGRAAAQP